MDKKWGECNKKNMKRKKEMWTTLIVLVFVVILDSVQLYSAGI